MTAHTTSVRTVNPASLGASTPAQQTPLPTPIGLYVHIPFCERKCPYCDFNTYAGMASLYADYVDALCLDLARWGSALAARPVATVFLGGGTPTVLDEALLARIFQAIQDHFTLLPGAEITCEANPGAVDRAKFQALRRLGVNRLSMGIQSFQPEELRFLGRIHSAEEGAEAFQAARAAGFSNINLDFIFGLPGQEAKSWAATLDRAVALGPEHLSLYSLIVEPGTPLHHWVESGRVPAPDEDQAALLYEMAMARLDRAGYVQYEVSNWARGEGASPGVSRPTEPTHVCRHNRIYWRNQEYLGLGPGAHSHLTLAQGAASIPQELRWGNLRSVPEYIRRVQAGQSTVDFQEVIHPRLAMGETMMLGLRLLQEGVPFATFQERHGQDLRQVFRAELARLTEWGLLAVDEERVRLTRRGLLLGNQVFAAFLPDAS